MKRRRETEIIMDVLAQAGIESSDIIRNHVNAGLKQIRREKYEERLRQMENRKLSHIIRHKKMKKEVK